MRFKIRKNLAITLLLIVVVLAALFLKTETYLLTKPNIKSNPATEVWGKYPTPENPEYRFKDTFSFLEKTSHTIASHIPKSKIAWAHPTNYGKRFAQDIQGKYVKNQPIIVLHETSNSANSAINFFQNPNYDEKVQASYHTLIELDGTIIYIVPPDKRAFGAANSVFDTPNGAETVQTNPKIAPSVNNFAYHIGLETPPDGRGNQKQNHSGYTNAQYNSLAWLIAQIDIPDRRITTHKEVDRSGKRIDPRSFNLNKLLILLHSNRQ